ncbi:putative metalloprotease CJM1_0395 family protein [Alteromonas halophila]|uniref:Catalase n=1 Tax=Alteromonas halophila TaxID=516698 RepID=A0A918JPP2_9ALTE|nr:putative metalloprotease CJM1_0395 family protein [Alteromonas halophila]GGW90922.1 hypothetical protein GCM10007391_26540 [Alteromonas halophila]
MNIVLPIPTTLVTPTANVNTEAARRDNILRETIPQTTESDQSASQKGLGSESDRVRTPGQQPTPLTYERPQIQGGAGAQGGISADNRKDNASDESAGKENAKEQQKEANKQEIKELEARDREVRSHEKAHAATGGQYAGAPKYEYTQGPDGKRYVTDGEVSIDISEAQTPEKTLRKMEQVRAAALAPAQPSAQDLQVAAEASRKAFEARSDIARERTESLSNSDSEQTVDAASITPPSLDDLVDRGNISPPTRTLNDVVLSARETIREAREQVQPEPGQRSLDIDDQSRARIDRIQQFYSSTVTPSDTGFSASA